jgi:hypothetical protein
MAAARKKRRPSRPPASPNRHARARRLDTRLRQLFELLQKGGFPNATTLARKLEVCTRTIRRDIELLRTYHHIAGIPATQPPRSKSSSSSTPGPPDSCRNVNGMPPRISSITPTLPAAPSPSASPARPRSNAGSSAGANTPPSSRLPNSRRNSVTPPTPSSPTPPPAPPPDFLSRISSRPCSRPGGPKDDSPRRESWVDVGYGTPAPAGRQNPLLPDSFIERPSIFPTAGTIVVEHHTTPTPTAFCPLAQGWSEARGQPWVPCQNRIQPHRGCGYAGHPTTHRQPQFPYAAKPRRRTATVVRSLRTPRLRAERVHWRAPTMHGVRAEAQGRRKDTPLSFPPAFLRVFACSSFPSVKSVKSVDVINPSPGEICGPKKIPTIFPHGHDSVLPPVLAFHLT